MQEAPELDYMGDLGCVGHPVAGSAQAAPTNVSNVSVPAENAPPSHPSGPEQPASRPPLRPAHIQIRSVLNSVHRHEKCGVCDMLD